MSEKVGAEREGGPKDKNLITLPSREEMLRRLIGVIDEPHLRERFFPLLLKSAGEERVPEGIILMLSLAIHDYTEGMPPVMTKLMYMRLPEFIDALVKDEQVAAQTKALYKKTMGQA